MRAVADLIRGRFGESATKPRDWLVFLTSLALIFCALPATAAPSLENAVKATYLYKFTPFIVWPDTAFSGTGAPFNICIVGNDAFADLAAQAAAGQRYDTHNIAIRKIAMPDASCQILYIPGSDSAVIAAALSMANGKPILTVTDAGTGAAHGIVVFITDAGHVRFDIDGAAAAQNGLTISSKLLSLSRSANRAGTP